MILLIESAVLLSVQVDLQPSFVVISGIIECNSLLAATLAEGLAIIC